MKLENSGDAGAGRDLDFYKTSLMNIFLTFVS